MDNNSIDQLQEKIEGLLEQVRSEYEGSELEARVLDLRDRLEETIINYPLRSLAVGLIVGVLLGKLFSDNDD